MTNQNENSTSESRLPHPPAASTDENERLESAPNQAASNELTPAEQAKGTGNGMFALIAITLMVLAGSAVYIVGAAMRADEATVVAETDARDVIAEYDPDEFVREFEDDSTSPDGLPLAEPSDQVEDQQSNAEQDQRTVDGTGDDAGTTEAESTPTTEPPVLGEDGRHPGRDIDPNDIAMAFVSRIPGDTYGTVGYLMSNGDRFETSLRCERIDLNDVRGICLSSDTGLGGSGQGLILDASLVPLQSFGLVTPSRAAVSPSGDVVAWTGFTLGHSYLADGEFATLTQVISVSREIGANLETAFETYRDGELWVDPERNYWGVTFVDDDRFYATMQSQGVTSLVEGSIASAEIHVFQDGASCPEVSPDGSTIVAKELRDGGFQLVAIDVETGARRDLGETRMVDDQVEFIDDDTIVYGIPNLEEGTEAQPAFDIWSLDIAPGSTPNLVVPFADSPAV